MKSRQTSHQSLKRCRAADPHPRRQNHQRRSPPAVLGLVRTPQVCREVIVPPAAVNAPFLPTVFAQVFRVQLGKFFQEFPRAIVQLLRHHNLQNRVQVAGLACLAVNDAFAAKS